jgi:hypothetical protein
MPAVYDVDHSNTGLAGAADFFGITGQKNRKKNRHAIFNGKEQ